MSAPVTADSLRASNPNILFIISRSKNGNLVVYEAKLTNGQLDPNNPVEVYWMDVDPEYVQKRIKAGKTSDRTELNTLEKQFAYGLSSESLGGGRYKITLVALKERPVVVFVENGKPKALMTINGEYDWN